MLAARMAAAAQRNFAKTTLFAKFPRVSAQDVRTERYPINAGGLLRGTREQPPSRPLTKKRGEWQQPVRGHIDRQSLSPRRRVTIAAAIERSEPHFQTSFHRAFLL